MRACGACGGVALGEGGGEREPRAAPAGADGAFLGPREQRAGVPGEGRERRNQPGVERVLGERDDEHADDTARDGDRADERAVQPELAGAGGQAGATRREAAEQRGQREVQERAGARERARLEDVEQRRQRALAEVEQQRGVRAGGRGDAGGAGLGEQQGHERGAGDPPGAVGDVHERALGIGRERAARDGVEQLALALERAAALLAAADRDQRQRERAGGEAEQVELVVAKQGVPSRRTIASAPSRSLPSSTGTTATPSASAVHGSSPTLALPVVADREPAAARQPRDVLVARHQPRERRERQTGQVAVALVARGGRLQGGQGRDVLASEGHGQIHRSRRPLPLAACLRPSSSSTPRPAGT